MVGRDTHPAPGGPPCRAEERLGYHAAIRPGLGAHVTQRLVVVIISRDGVPVRQHRRRARLVTRLALRDAPGLHA